MFVSILATYQVVMNVKKTRVYRRITRKKAPPLHNTPLHEHTRWYIVCLIFRPSIYHRGYVEYHTPYGDRLKIVSNSKIIMDTVHPQRAQVWTPAWRRQLCPITAVIRTSLRPQRHRYLLLPRLERRSRRFSPGSACLPVPVLVLPIPRSHSLAIVHNVSTPPQYQSPSLPHPVLTTSPPHHTPSLPHPVLTTPPQYHTPSLPHPVLTTPPPHHTHSSPHPLLPHPSSPHPSCGAAVMGAITGDTLDTTPPYNSTPGDNIFKRQIVITGVCILPCYTI